MHADPGLAPSKCPAPAVKQDRRQESEAGARAVYTETVETVKNVSETDKDQRGQERTAETAGLFRYLGISAFCLIFSRIYGLFSHGIRSPWMTFLAAWPFLLGALPTALRLVLKGPRTGPEPQRPEAEAVSGDRSRANTKEAGSSSGEGEAAYAQRPETGQGEKEAAARRQVRLTLMTDLYPFGIAALTVASLLKGILEIAGTDSLYPDLLLGAGALMTLAGAAAGYLYSRQNRAENI